MAAPASALRSAGLGPEDHLFQQDLVCRVVPAAQPATFTQGLSLMDTNLLP